MENRWSQPEVTIYLRLSNYQLHILIGEDSQFENIERRSDGLRQFVALLMFLTHKPSYSIKPILLIDEVEIHLHYDAQADLVQTLAEQEIAEKVIYTTHSIGCLPEDLGMGVRVVKQLENQHSGLV